MYWPLPGSVSMNLLPLTEEKSIQSATKSPKLIGRINLVQCKLLGADINLIQVLVLLCRTILRKMKKIYHLSTCSTCQRILKELNPGNDVVLQDIKTEPITIQQLEQMEELAGSFEALFSRKAMKYRAMGLHEKALTEKDYKKLILEEYTFLKRPVIIIKKEIFIGNSKVTVAEAKKKI